MTSTYTGDPGNVPIDEVRLILGDTTAPFLFSDQEIEWFLVQADANARSAAVLGAGAAAARFAGLVDSSVGDVRKSYSQKAKGYADLAARLTAAAEAAGDIIPVPWAGGLSYSERHANDDDTDFIPGYFHEDMDARPGTVDQTDRRGRSFR